MYVKTVVIVVVMLSILTVACKSSASSAVPAAQVAKGVPANEIAKANEPSTGSIVGGQTASVGLSAIPPLPVMTLGYQNEVIEGTQGSYCWPKSRAPNTGVLLTVCADTFGPRGLGDGTQVQAGDTMTALIEAVEPANEMGVGISTLDMKTIVYSQMLDLSGTFAMPADLPAGAYVLVLSGQWDEGDISYYFGLNVSSGVPFAADKTPTDGQCLPATALMVSVDDHWTLTGPASIPDGFPSDLPPGVAEMSTIVFVEGVESVTQSAQRNGPPVDHISLSTKVTELTRDANGEVLSSETNTRTSAPLSVSNLGPVLTPDWACHRVAWMETWPDGMEASTGERTLASGITTMVFSVEQPFVIDDLGIDAVMEIHHGYDKATGRMVLSDTTVTGTKDDLPLEMSMYQEIVVIPGALNVPNNTGTDREAKIILLTQEPSPGPRWVMLALKFGTLVSDNGCLRVQDMNSDTSHLVIWPPDYQLSADSNHVLNEDGETVAVIGQGVRLSGGEIFTSLRLNQQFQRWIPDKCLGPVWSVGSEVSVVDLKSDLNAPNQVAGTVVPRSVHQSEQDAFLTDA